MRSYRRRIRRKYAAKGFLYELTRITGRRPRVRAASYKRKRKLKELEIVLINVIAISVILLMLVYIRGMFKSPYKRIDTSLERLAAFNIPYKTLPVLKELSNRYAISFAELTAIYALENQFFPVKLETPAEGELEESLITGYNKIKQSYDPKQLEPYVRILDSIYSEMKYFPIPTGYDDDDSTTFMYGDSWNSPRSYGGDRPHEGTDISDRENIPGRIPIVSITGGYVQNTGWNELGGYYVGITTGAGNYYYYAHLDSVAKGLAKDSVILPGQLLGYMGNTGYSKKEGTKGNFVTHLHVGISVNTDLTSKDFWINPYPFLRFIEDNRVAYQRE